MLRNESVVTDCCTWPQASHKRSVCGGHVRRSSGELVPLRREQRLGDSTVVTREYLRKQDTGDPLGLPSGLVPSIMDV